MPPSGNLIVRPIANFVAALNNARTALYTPPRGYINTLSDSDFPSPLQPVQPMGPPKAEPIQWPFDWGRNINYTPRDDAEYSSSDLRYLATYPLARICIENNKDMISRMPFTIQLRAKQGETSKARALRAQDDPNLKKLRKFFERPNPQQDWQEFLRPVLEDMLVIDAASVYIARNKDGTPTELRWVEGASITVLIDEHGWRPAPPNPAYQQLWQGYPRLDLTTDQLIYRPRNIVPRNTQSSFIYGYSPTEQVAKEIRVGIARLQFVYDFYKEGSIPGGMQFVPPGTPPDKIREAQQWLDATYAGNLGARRRLLLLQGWQEAGHAEQLAFPKEPALADAYDEMHTRKLCFAYGTSPQRLMRAMNRASAETSQTAAEEEGTLPWMEWLKGLCDHIIQRVFLLEDYEFTYDPFHEMDLLKQSQADQRAVDGGLYSVNEIREKRGDDPSANPAADLLNIKTPQGYIPLGTVLQPTVAAPKPGSRPPSPSSPPAQKTNGHSTWAVCQKHSGGYPRTYCRDCVSAELARIDAGEHNELRTL